MTIALIIIVAFALFLYAYKEWDYDISRYNIVANLEDINTTNLGAWYTDIEEKYPAQEHFDTNGIPLIDHEGKVEAYCNPVTIAWYALSAFEHFIKTNDEKAKQDFFLQADWLVKNAHETKEGFTVWQYEKAPAGVSDVRDHWVSAMAQGLGISVLTRAYQQTGEDRYLKAVHNAMKSFRYDADEGGVRSREDGIFYEEIQSKQNWHILNGFITSLLGLYDCYRATGDTEARDLFKAGIKTLELNLTRYDTGFWSRYSFYGVKKWPFFWEPLATMHYHNEHIAQLKVLSLLTGKKAFEVMAEKWDGYQHSISCRVLHFFYAKFLFRIQRIHFHLFQG